MHGVSGSIAGAGAALPPLVEARPGFPAEIDEAAAAADPARAFLRAAWYEAAGGRDPRTLVARRADGSILAALPTVRLAPLLRGIAGPYWPLRSFPVARDASPGELAAVLGHCAARRLLGPAWRLGPLPADDPCARLLAAAAVRRPVERRLGTSWRLDLAALAASGWPKPSSRKKNRWFERQLAAYGALGWREVAARDWTADLLDRLARVEANGWIGSQADADAKFLDPRARAAWTRAAADPALGAMLRVALLEAGGELAAFSLELECGDGAYVLANSYDARFARHSPGRLLAYRGFAAMAARGVALVDWGVGDGGYKARTGAEPGPPMLDWLFVPPMLAPLARLLWRS